MKQTKKILKIATQTDLVICNMCGKKITLHKYHDNFLSVKKTWGYGSAHDGETHSFELCEECYDDMLNQFKIGV